MIYEATDIIYAKHVNKQQRNYKQNQKMILDIVWSGRSEHPNLELHD